MLLYNKIRIMCNKVILKNRINNFLVETSFHQFSNMTSSGLKEMFILQFYIHTKVYQKLCGLSINIASFSCLLKRVDFDVIVDHLALTHIIKSKMEPATTRIKRLLELISSYSFNLYYIKGKDMILSDFL